MKVLYCVSQLAMRGGAERIVISKMNALVEQYNIEVHVLIADQKGREYAYPIDSRVNVYDMKVSEYVPLKTIPFLTFAQTCLKLRKVYTEKILQISPDVIFVIERGFDDFVIPFICTHIPRIREFHLSREAAKIKEKAISGCLNRFKTKFLNKIVYSLFNKYDGVVLLTKRDMLYSHYHTKTYVIPNFIPKLPKEKSLLNQKKVISVGRLDKNKNFKDQILAWQKVNKIYPDWSLHIYGEGSERKYLEKLVHDLKLDNVVFFHGNVSNINDYYVNSSLMICTSRADGFSMVLIEAMSFGLPCVSYDTPCGPSEIIRDGVDGYLIGVDDIDFLADRVIYLIEHPDKRNKMGCAAREQVAKFTEKEIMPKWLSLFNQLKNKQ